MNHSAAKILAEHLYGAHVLDDPESTGFVFPGYVSFLPDGDSVPHEAASLIDTEGVADGRLMGTGENIIHHGVQVMVRSLTHAAGWAKAWAILANLQALARATVTIDMATYTIHNVSLSGTVMAMGIEVGAKRRYLFSVNFLATISQA